MINSLQTFVKQAVVVDAEGDLVGGINRIEIDGDSVFIVLDTVDEPSGGERKFENIKNFVSTPIFAGAKK